jgi:hypothetical protein
MAASLASRRPLPIGSRPVDLVLAVFMLINIPIVLLVESQAVFPSVFFPQSLLDAVQWYVHLSGDYLVRDRPPFFRGLVLAELVFQLPLLVVNSYAFIAGKGWGRITGILFGAQLFTTMVCTGFLAFSSTPCQDFGNVLSFILGVREGDGGVISM